MTERVPGCNLRIFSNFPLHTPSQARRWLASSPIGGAKGGCAAGVATTYPLRRHRYLPSAAKPGRYHNERTEISAWVI